MTTLLIALIAAITTTAEGLRFLCKHALAKRRAKQDIFPPRRTIETTLDDTVPF